MTFSLRDYQIEAIRAARELVRTGIRRVLVVAPTGSGKTVIASEIIRRLVAKGNRALFLAHRKELIDQCSGKLSDLGIAHGIIRADDSRYDAAAPVQVASIPTLLAGRVKLPLSDLVVVDEAHHARSDSWTTALGLYADVPLLGLTATPWRLDGKGLGDLFDAEIVVSRPGELIKAGWLVPYTGWAYESLDTSQLRMTGTDFTEGELAGLVVGGQGAKVLGDIVEQYRAHADGKRAIAFACSIEHSKKLRDRFLESGVQAEHVDGTTPDGERAGILSRLASGETPVVCNCNVLTEGFDCPAAEVAILARPTLSTSLYLQMVGRVMRPLPGKELARIHDHAGNILKLGHGLPDADRDYSLCSDSAAARRDRAESAPALTTCRKCGAIFPAKVCPCPVCGSEPVPVKRRGVKEEREARAVALEKLRESGPRSDHEAQSYLARMVQIAQEKGYKPGWVPTRYKARFGRWPTDSQLRAAGWSRQ